MTIELSGKTNVATTNNTDLDIMHLIFTVEIDGLTETYTLSATRS